MEEEQKKKKKSKFRTMDESMMENFSFSFSPVLYRLFSD